MTITCLTISESNLIKVHKPQPPRRLDRDLTEFMTRFGGRKTSKYTYAFPKSEEVLKFLDDYLTDRYQVRGINPLPYCVEIHYFDR